MSTIDTAYVEIRPVIKGFEAEATRQVKQGSSKAGTEAGKTFGSSFKRALSGTVGKTAGGFLLASGIEQTLSHTIGLIKELGQAGAEDQQRRVLLNKSLQNLGLTTQLYGKQIDEVLNREGRLKGFTDTQLTDAFIRLNTVVHDNARAYKDLNLAEDISRQRKIPLTQSALLLARAESGVFTSLRRLGLTTPVLTAAESKLTKERQKRILTNRLLVQLEQKFGGTALAVSKTAFGATERLHVAFQELQEDIGKALLPSITRVSNAVADYLGTAEHQREVQKDVNKFLKEGGEVAHSLFEGLKVIKTVGEPLVNIMGGLADSIKLLLEAMLVGKVLKFAGALDLVGPAAIRAGSGVATAEAEIGIAGGTAGTAASRVGLLRTNLLRLGEIGAIAIVIDETINRFTNGPKPAGKPGSEIDNSGLFVPGGTQGVPNDQVELPGFDGTTALGQVTGPNPLPVKVTELPPIGSFGTPTGPKGLSDTQNFKLALGADPENLGLLRQQADSDRAAIAFLKKRRDNSKITNKEFVAQTLAYTNDLQSTEATIQGINKKAADDAQALRDKNKQDAQDRIQAAKDEADRIASIKEALAQSVLQAAEVTKGTADDIKAHRALITYYKGEARRLRARKDELGALAADASAASQSADIRSIKTEVAKQAKDDADKRAQEAKDRKTRFQSLREQRLQLRVQQAELTKTNKDDIAAQKALIKYYGKQEVRLRESGALAASVAAKSNKISAMLALKNLTGQSGTGETSAEFFRDAISNFKAFGSNIAGPGGILSGQQARGAFAGLALAGAAPDRAAQVLAINSSNQLTEQQKQTRILQLIAGSLGAKGAAGPKPAGKRGTEKATTLTRQQAVAFFGGQGVD